MKFIDKIYHKLRPDSIAALPPPTISTPWGPVSESARLQAVANMKDDAALRERVQQLVINEMGGDATRGRVEFLRRYPEIFSED